MNIPDQELIPLLKKGAEYLRSHELSHGYFFNNQPDRGISCYEILEKNTEPKEVCAVGSVWAGRYFSGEQPEFTNAGERGRYYESLLMSLVPQLCVLFFNFLVHSKNQRAKKYDGNLLSFSDTSDDKEEIAALLEEMAEYVQKNPEAAQSRECM